MSEISLQHYLETKIQSSYDLIGQRLNSVEDNIALALTASKEAATKADIAMEKRLDLLNEFREAMKDQTYQYLTKEEYGLRHSYIEARLRIIEDKLSAMESRGGVFHAIWGYVVGAVGAIVVLWNLLKGYIH